LSLDKVPLLLFSQKNEEQKEDISRNQAYTLIELKENMLCPRDSILLSQLHVSFNVHYFNFCTTIKPSAPITNMQTLTFKTQTMLVFFYAAGFIVVDISEDKEVQFSRVQKAMLCYNWWISIHFVTLFLWSVWLLMCDNQQQ